jgi:hypothetical protein
LNFDFIKLSKYRLVTHDGPPFIFQYELFCLFCLGKLEKPKKKWKIVILSTSLDVIFYNLHQYERNRSSVGGIVTVESVNIPVREE